MAAAERGLVGEVYLSRHVRAGCGVSSVGISLAPVWGLCYIISGERSKTPSEDFPRGLSVTRQPWASRAGVSPCRSSDSRIAYTQLKTGQKRAARLPPKPRGGDFHRGALISCEDSEVPGLQVGNHLLCVPPNT